MTTDPGGAAESRAATVLVVDDSEPIRRIVTALLDRHPALRVVGEATDGQDAIDTAIRVRPDLILLDHQMSPMTGLEAVPSLRRCVPDALVVIYSNTPVCELEPPPAPRAPMPASTSSRRRAALWQSSTSSSPHPGSDDPDLAAA
jgi:CheY-like chemotaxis protein